MKKVLVLVLALAMVMGCTAAFADKIGYTCMDGTNPFFVALEGAIREVVEANGDELISLDPQNSNEKQLNLIEDMISQGIVAMFVNPVDKDGITPGLDALKNAGIPMFGFDTEVAEMDYLVTYAGSDNYNAGYVCGVDLAEKLPDGGPIIVLDSPTMQSVVDRTNGFLAAIEEKAPGKFNRLHGQPGAGQSERHRRPDRQPRCRRHLRRQRSHRPGRRRRCGSRPVQVPDLRR